MAKPPVINRQSHDREWHYDATQLKSNLHRLDGPALEVMRRSFPVFWYYKGTFYAKEDHWKIGKFYDLIK